MGYSRFLNFFRQINWQIVKIIVLRTFERRLMGLSAEIAFNTILALFPTILAILTALGLFEQELQVNLRQLAVQYKDVVPGMAWSLLKDFVNEITRTKSKSLFSLSFVFAIWIASAALGAAMNALDQILQVPREKKRPFWQARSISIFITLGTIFFLFIASFIVLLGDSMVKFAVDLMVELPVPQTGVFLLSIFWRILSWPIALSLVVAIIIIIYQIYQAPSEQKYPFHKVRRILFIIVIGTVLLLLIGVFLIFINELIINLEFDYSLATLLVNTWRFLSWPVALIFVSMAFAFVYRIGSSYWVPGTPLLPGAILAAISWAVVSALFRLYVSNFGQYNKVYGAVGAVIVLMLWLQMTSLVMLIGYQINITVGESMRREEENK